MHTGFSTLGNAIRARDHDQLRLLFSKGVNPRDTTELGIYPMAVAACCDGLESISMLSAYCADFEPPYAELKPPLNYAIEAGNYETLAYLIDHGADLNKSYADFETPLHQACISGDIKTAILLIEGGARTLVRDEKGLNCLDHLRSDLTMGSFAKISSFFPSRYVLGTFFPLRNRSDLLDVVKISVKILQDKIRLNKKIRNIRGLTSNFVSEIVLREEKVRSFSNAIQYHLYQALTLSQSKAPEINQLTSLIKALYGAIDRHKEDHAEHNGSSTKERITTFLLCHYGNPKLRDIETGSNIAHISITLRLRGLTVQLMRNERFSSLVNSSDGDLNRPLHLATSQRDYWAIELLCSSGADVNTCNRRGLSPLHVAIIQEDILAIQLLLKHHANILLKPRNNQEISDLIETIVAKNADLSDLFRRHKQNSASSSIFSENNPFAAIIRGKSY